MEIYLLKTKETGATIPYKTISALVEDNTTDQLGITKHMLRKHVWDASTNYEYSNEKIEIQAVYLKGMAEVMLGKLAVELAKLDIPFVARKKGTGEIVVKDVVLVYKRGFVLKDKSRRFASLEEVVEFLKGIN